MSAALAMLIALVIDAAIGWPDALFRRVGHPVSWIGAAIARGERALNAGTPAQRKRAGIFLTVAIVGGAAGLAWALARALPSGMPGILLTGLLAWPFVAHTALKEHVVAVALPLGQGDIEGARVAVSHIVGRAPETMDGPAIARAALESLAENASDGVVAPLFWGLILGLPGIVAYKAINTLDSMIGYRNDRYRDFGWGAARLDDLANLLPARLTGGLIAIAAKGVRGPSFRTMLRDASRHRSPNAGWPEAAMAGALAVRLSGPRIYDGVASDDPWLNPVAGDPRAEDIMRGIAVYRSAMAIVAILLALCAIPVLG